MPGVSPAAEQLSQSVVLGLIALEDAGKLESNESLCVVALAAAKLLAKDPSELSRNMRLCAVQAALPLWVVRLLRDLALTASSLSTPSSAPSSSSSFPPPPPSASPSPSASTPPSSPPPPSSPSPALERGVVVKFTDFLARRRPEPGPPPL